MTGAEQRLLAQIDRHPCEHSIITVSEQDIRDVLKDLDSWRSLAQSTRACADERLKIIEALAKQEDSCCSRFSLSAC